MRNDQDGSSQQRLKHRHGALPMPEFRPDDTALLVVDIQYGDAHPDYGLLKRMRDRGMSDDAAYYTERVRDLVIPNTRRLLDACRATGINVIHTGIQSLTPDGRD
ncbi:MAG: cysteine hydrolase, partial [Chloroflexota bacterium]|nr:cysteine hydrolase [Chloroflexota bacterium]